MFLRHPKSFIGMFSFADARPKKNLCADRNATFPRLQYPRLERADHHPTACDPLPAAGIRAGVQLDMRDTDTLRTFHAVFACRHRARVHRRGVDRDVWRVEGTRAHPRRTAGFAGEEVVPAVDGSAGAHHRGDTHLHKGFPGAVPEDEEHRETKDDPGHMLWLCEVCVVSVSESWYSDIDVRAPLVACSRRIACLSPNQRLSCWCGLSSIE